MLSHYLGDRPFWRVAMRLALPIALQNMLVASFTLVDTLMVGQLGDIPLSAVGMAGQWSWFMSMVLFGIASGASVFISQFWGVRAMNGIRRTFGIALLSSLLLAAVFFAFGFFLPRQVMLVFNQDPQVVAAGTDYLKIACWSYPALAITQISGITLRGTERVKLPMYVAAVTTVANAVLDYIMIFGAFGFEGMGVKGAALATVISAWLGPVLTYGISAVQKNILIAPLKEFFGFNRYDVAEFYKRATPVIFNEGAWGLGTVIFNVIFSNLGYEYYAAVTILRTFENIAFVFFVGLCNACGIMVGKSVGSGKIRRAVEDSRRFAVVVPLLSVVVGAVIILLRSQLVSIFNLGNNITQYTLGIAEIIMVIYAVELGVRNIPYIFIVGIFRPGGDTIRGVKYDLLCLWALSLPATAIAAFVLELPFVVCFAVMYVFEDYVKTILCLRHFRSGRWLMPVTESGKAGLEEYRLDSGKV